MWRMMELQDKQTAETVEKPKLFTMIWPIVLELIITGLIANVNQAILNDFSSDAIAVTSSGAQIIVVILNIYCIISVGTTILLAPLVGAKRYEDCNRLICAAVTVNFLLSIVISLVGILFVPTMIKLLNIPVELYDMARQYMVVSIGFSFLQSIIITLNAVFRSFGEMKKVLVTMISISLLGMIFTKLISVGIPKSAQTMIHYSLAGIVAQLFGVAMFLVMLMRQKIFRFHYSFRGLYGTIRKMLPRIFHYGIPAGFEGLIYLTSQTIVVSFIGILGTNALLAKGFAGNVSYYMSLTTSSTAAGVSIVVGQLIGAGKINEVKRVSKKVIGLDILITATVCLISLFLGPRILRIYTEDPSILTTAMQVLFVSVVLELMRCVTGNLIAILKATGDVSFPFTIVIIGSIINIAISYYMGITLQIGLVGIWLGYIADVFFRGVACSIKFHKNMKEYKGRVNMDFMDSM